jgi:hypothetical protein
MKLEKSFVSGCYSICPIQQYGVRRVGYPRGDVPRSIQTPMKTGRIAGMSICRRVGPILPQAIIWNGIGVSRTTEPRTIIIIKDAIGFPMDIRDRGSSGLLREETAVTR